MTLGDYLRLARIDRGLKQTELSERLGVVYQTIVKWENNMGNIGPGSQLRVIAFLGYDPTQPAQAQQQTLRGFDVENLSPHFQ